MDEKEEKNESLRVQKATYIREQIQKQREAEDAVLAQKKAEIKQQKQQARAEKRAARKQWFTEKKEKLFHHPEKEAENV